MIAILLASLAFANAAPQYYHRHHHQGFPHHHHGHQGLTDSYFRENTFDAGSFWMGLAKEMQRMDELLNDFVKHFPSSVSTEGIEGNEYIITISLPGFEEKDVVVKAREGVLMIQANHRTEEGSQRSYMDLRTLPTYINVAGTWTYDKEQLKIVFPVTKKPEDTTEAREDDEEVTEAPPRGDHSREEMGTSDDNTNVDVDIDRRAQDPDSELLTNVIPKHSVEGTTYAVDFNNEVEFVTVSY